jgi:hypothetical protein
MLGDEVEPVLCYPGRDVVDQRLTELQLNMEIKSDGTTEAMGMHAQFLSDCGFVANGLGCTVVSFLFI